MKTITIRIDDKLHKDLKLKIVEDETTIQDYILNFIKKELNEKKS